MTAPKLTTTPEYPVLHTDDTGERPTLITVGDFASIIVGNDDLETLSDAWTSGQLDVIETLANTGSYVDRDEGFAFAVFTDHPESVRAQLAELQSEISAYEKECAL